MQMPARTRRPDRGFDIALPKFRRLIRRLLVEKRNARISLTMNVRFIKDTRMDTAIDADGQILGADGVDVLTVPFNSNVHLMQYMGGREEEQVEAMTEQITNSLEAFNSGGSGWVLAEIMGFDAQVMECQPLQGACTSHRTIYVKKSGLLIEHLGQQKEQPLDGERCFFRAVARGILNCSEDSDQAEKALEEYIHANMVENVNTPVQIGDIDRFEKGNEHLDIAVNVLMQDEASMDMYPTHASKKLKAKHVINLVLFHMEAEGCNDDKGSGKQNKAPEENGLEEEQEEVMHAVKHYAWIPDMDAIVSRWRKDKNGKWFKNNGLLCYNCFLFFSNEEVLQHHQEWCHSSTGQIKSLPMAGETVKFTNIKHQILQPFFFVYDFETYNTPVPTESACSCGKESGKSTKCAHKTKVITEHVPFAFGLIMVSRYGQVVEHISYLGDDAAEQFVRTVLRLEKKYKALVNDTNVPLIKTSEVVAAFDKAKVCHICNKPFKFGDKVFDHDHLTGEFVGAAHNRCNLLRVEVKDKLTGLAHNNIGYDLHIVLRALTAMKDSESDQLTFEGKPITLEGIALNKQKFKMLRINDVTLLDSLSFLNDSLEQLVANLKASNHPFKLMRQWIKDEAKLELLGRKGFFPYEWLTDKTKLDETQLPPPAAFASKLAGTAEASPNDYAHATKVWETFECQTMRDYTELYLLSDCYQLLEAVTEFRTTVFESFQLDILHYLSLPHAARDFLFKMSGAEVELLTDIDMIHMIKDNIR